MTLIVCIGGAGVDQLVSVRHSEQEVSGSIFSDFNVCFEFSLLRVAMALNPRKTEHWQREGGGGGQKGGAPSAPTDTSFVTEGTTDVK